MNISDPLFTVILCVRNGEDLIGDALDSLQRQTHSSFEVLVVDDASTDHSRAIAETHPVVTRVLAGPGRGLAMARNLASSVAAGKYLTFLDHDDLYHPQRLARVAAWLADQPGQPVVYTGVSAFSEKLDKDGTPATAGPPDTDWPKAWIEPGTALDLLAVDDGIIDVRGTDTEMRRDHEQVLTWCAPGAALFVKREVLITVGGFPTQTGPAEDFLMLMNLSRYVDIVEIDQPTYFYRLRPDSETRGMGIPWPYLSAAASVRFGGQHMDFDRAIGKGEPLPRDFILEDLLAEGVRRGMRRDGVGPLYHFICLLYPSWRSRMSIARRLGRESARRRVRRARS